jgi:rhodanese-related sulfurtransferase
MNIFQKLFSDTPKVDLKSMVEEGAYLVDVRTPAEFAEGHVNGSVNIPLDNVVSELPKFKNKKNIIVFCRSGNRSGQAKSILEQNGITGVVNGGTWQDVNQFVQ